MATYKSSYTGPQIDQAVSHAVNMDVNPTAGHTDRVVSSGGVKSAITNAMTWHFLGNAANVNDTVSISGYNELLVTITNTYNAVVASRIIPPQAFNGTEQNLSGIAADNTNYRLGAIFRISSTTLTLTSKYESNWGFQLLYVYGR